MPPKEHNLEFPPKSSETMTDSKEKEDGIPLEKINFFQGQKDILIVLQSYLHSIKDYFHLYATCKALRTFYSANPPLNGTALRLAATSSSELFGPEPYFLIAGVARQMGEWAIKKPENRIKFHDSFKTKGINGLFELCTKEAKITLKDLKNLVEFRRSILEPLLPIMEAYSNFDEMRILSKRNNTMEPYLQIAIFGDLFAPNVRNFCEPGVVADPLDLSIRRDWWVMCCPDAGSQASRELLGDRVSQRRDMKKIMAWPTIFDTQLEFNNNYVQPGAKADLFINVLLLQGLNTLKLMHKLGNRFIHRHEESWVDTLGTIDIGAATKVLCFDKDLGDHISIRTEISFVLEEMRDDTSSEEEDDDTNSEEEDDDTNSEEEDDDV
ncbi:hypothetical protein NHQ30_002153 [Ciborinia camelliae]|nr:hypothetical protein NHQ30_002153 [Ciborinia camelliae]